MTAVVPSSLIQLNENMDLEGHVFSINQFQIYPIDLTDYPRYENYSLSRNDWVIDVSKKTVFTELNIFAQFGFIKYPLVPSIRSLVNDETSRNILIGTPLFVI